MHGGQRVEAAAAREVEADWALVAGGDVASHPHHAAVEAAQVELEAEHGAQHLSRHPALPPHQLLHLLGVTGQLVPQKVPSEGS